MVRQSILDRLASSPRESETAQRRELSKALPRTRKRRCNAHAAVLSSDRRQAVRPLLDNIRDNPRLDEVIDRLGYWSTG